MCPNSPPALCRPRSSWPFVTTPTPSPSETLRKTKSVGAAASPRAPQICASAHALPAFSITTGRPGLRRERLLERHVAPAQPRREQHSGAGAVDHPGHHHAHAVAATELRVALERVSDPAGELDDQALRVALRGEARHARRAARRRCPSPSGTSASAAGRSRPRSAAASRGRGTSACGPGAPRRSHPRTRAPRRSVRSRAR